MEVPGTRTGDEVTTDERLTHLESQVRNHDVAIDLLVSIGERQQTLLEEIRQDVKETRQDAKMTQRLWVHLARKHGWLEDEDWPPPDSA